MRSEASLQSPDSSAKGVRDHPVLTAMGLVLVVCALVISYGLLLIPFLYSRHDTLWIAYSLAVTSLGIVSLVADFKDILLDTFSQSAAPESIARIGWYSMLLAVLVGLGSITIFGFYDGIRMAVGSAAQAGIAVFILVYVRLSYRYLRHAESVA